MIVSDLRAASRSLRRSPMFVVMTTLVLGIGIGLTTTMLSMLDAIRNPYVPYRNPEQLFSVIAFGGGSGGGVTESAKRLALIEGSRSFAGVATQSESSSQTPIVVDGRNRPDNVNWVSEDYFSLVGVRPEAGRVLTSSPADDDAAVISYGLWQSAFGSRSLDGGLSITVGDRTYRVVGVMPREMRGMFSARYPGVWVRNTAGRTEFPIVRLRDGVSLQSAYAELNLVAARLKAAYGPGRQPFQFRLDPLQPEPGELRDHQKAMGAAAILILVIACANLANLMLVRGISRRKELSLRLALGAGRWRLVKQLMTESMVIAALGGVVGTVLTVWGIGVIRYAFPSQGSWFGFLPPHLSVRVYLAALAVTVLSVLAFGAGPAVAASGVQLSEPLKESRGTTSRRTRRAYSLVVVAQVALCLSLLMGSGLLLRSVALTAAFDRGFLADGIVVSQLRMVPGRLPDSSAVSPAYRDVLARLARVPGVEQVTTSARVRNLGSAVTSDAEGPESPFVNARVHHSVSWNYLRVLGVAVVSGRDFEPGDEDGVAPVAIVTDSLAAMLWPGTDPVGRMVKLGAAGALGEWVRVVGVARQFNPPGEPGYPLVVRPRDPNRLRDVVARVSEDQTIMVDRLQAELRAAAPGHYVGGFQRWLASWELALAEGTLLARLFGVFGLLSLGLAAVGLYGVLAYAVSQRLREFGVRVALGALPRDLAKLVFRDGTLMILGGTAIGAWIAMAGGHLLSGLLRVVPTDVVSLVGAEAILILVGFAACLAPARRAAKADPLQIVRAL